jgi:hypothetical protein
VQRAAGFVCVGVPSTCRLACRRSSGSRIAPVVNRTDGTLVVSPELADVLSTVIRRIREPDGAVPLVPVYDRYECVWRPPSPVLFQRRFPSEIRAISDSSLRTMLNAALPTPA